MRSKNISHGLIANGRIDRADTIRTATELFIAAASG
jgi:hypothetical protein